MSATARTLELLRKDGYHVWIVEKTIPFRGIKLDAFGFMDILAYRPNDSVVVAVQSTVGGEHARHVRKYADNPKVQRLILDWITKHKFVIVSWRKAGARGKRKLWTPRIEVVNAETFCESMAKIRVTSTTNGEVAGSSPASGQPL